MMLYYLKSIQEILQCLPSCSMNILYGIRWYYQNIVFYLGILLLIAAVIQYIFKPGTKIRYYACYSIVFLHSAFFGSLLLPYFIIGKRDLRNCLYGANVLKYTSKIIGIEYELQNGHFLEAKTGSAIIVANHQSVFDLVGMFEIWHVMERCTAIAKKLLFYIWPFGLLAWVAGVIFIDRVHGNEKTHKTINEAGDYIKEQKAKLWIFAEGTRNKNPSMLLPFKKGAFRLAICAQLPLIPVVFSPYYFIDKKTKYFGRGKIIIHVLAPIPTIGLTLHDMDELMQKIYNMMSDKNAELRQQMLKYKPKEIK